MKGEQQAQIMACGGGTEQMTDEEMELSVIEAKAPVTAPSASASMH
jgi:hypothetical protein